MTAGDDLGVPATGKQVTVTGMSIGRIRDGKLVEGWNNWDTMSLMEQIGAFQPGGNQQLRYNKLCLCEEE